MNFFHHSFRSIKEIASFYQAIAVRSLYHEVSLYPKPGLVSFIDSGSHTDMDGALFFKSLFGLRHYFYDIAFKSAQGFLPSQLVKSGIEAEKKMYEITNGINTHKGAIFSLGILCAVIAKLTYQQEKLSLLEIQEAIIEDWRPYLKTHDAPSDSHGMAMMAQYNIQGALQMASTGYESVFKLFMKLIHLEPLDQTFYGLLAYKQLLLSIDDTNVLYRAGMKGLIYARERVKTAINSDDKALSIKKAIELHHDFSKRQISPGGVADMVAMLYFLRNVFMRESY